MKMSKRDINRPIRPVERKRISLDSHKRGGRLRSPASDIASVWADQDRIRKEEQSLKVKNEPSLFARARKIAIKAFKKSKNQVSSLYSRTGKLHKKQRISLAVAVLAVVSLLAVGISKKLNSSSEVLGESNEIKQEQLQEEKPSFAVLLPQGKKQEDVGFRRVSPQNSAPSYVFIDELEGKKITVSQQELPEKFKVDQATELEKLAKDFQATDIIQIDQNKIYHGYSEKGDKQSLVFIKNDMLVLIGVQGKISDDVWASYIISLNY